MKKLLVLFILLCCTLIPNELAAHEPNQSYIFLRIYETEGIEGRFEINVREVNKVFNLNLPKNVTLEQIQPHIDKIRAYLLKNSAFSSTYGAHDVVFTKVEVLGVGLGNYIQVYFDLENITELPDNLDIYYNAVFEVDDEHTGFLTVEHNWKAGIVNNEKIIALDFTPNEPNDTLSLTDSSAWNGFVAMVKQGIWHIWIGLDHILFLLALILPSVVRRKEGATGYALSNWEPVMKFKPAFLYIIRVITFFTIAHTITLTLASLELVNLPSRFVETIIAFSIGLAAFHNIKPIFKGRDWVIAFVFGLFHGFGFASVLSDLGLTNEYLTLSLLGFNIGVEIGQLLIIAMIFPILYLIRKSKLYPKILVFGSILLIVISLYWCAERIFDVNLGLEDAIRRHGYQLAVKLGLR